MRLLLALWLVLTVAVAAHASGNPDARVYIDFDPPNYVHSLSPPALSFFRAYVCVDHLGDGIVGVAFRLDDLSWWDPASFSPATWTDMGGWGHPEGLAPWEYGIGHSNRRYASECVTADQEPVVIGYVEYYYFGPGGACIEILDSDEGAVLVYDCGTIDPNEACVLSHGSIGSGQCPPGDCETTPVDDWTWGSIKALYR